MAKIFVTGGSGFIAAHVLKVLVGLGYDTIFTVRTKEQGETILKGYQAVSGASLQYAIVEDITDENAMIQALEASGPLDYVIHTASPFTLNFTDPVDDMLNPAINGTVTTLKAIADHAPSVKRVVLTSSFAAVVNPLSGVKVYDETSWNPITWDQAVQDRRLTYAASKALAEKSAWDFIKTTRPNFDLVSINPPLVFGPPIHHIPSPAKVNTSNQRLLAMMQGQYSDGSLPPTGVFLWADVRDVALAHVRACEVAEAGNQRFLVAAGNFSNASLSNTIGKTHPDLESNLPKDPVDDTPAGVYGVNNSKTVTTLGIEFLTFTESVSDTVESLRELCI